MMDIFWSRVTKTHNCWNWIGTKNNRGYGLFRHKLVHRLSYEKFVGSIPPKMVVDHICRNKLCVNPNHLRVLTIKENAFRDIPLKSVCKNGHKMVDKNIYHEKRTRGNSSWTVRKCYECKKMYARRSYLQSKVRGGS